MLKTKIIQALRRSSSPVKWHALRRTKPVSSVFGLDRGTPIDRYYIEKFLFTNKELVRDCVLEIAESTYTRKFGGAQVTRSEVLHFTGENPAATIIGDLTNPASLPENRVDCFICTQTFNFIYDFKKAIEGAHHLVKKDGVLLATLGGISQISRYDMDRWGDYWRFTVLSALRAFEEVFGKGNVQVGSFGNVLSSISFLEGISAEELSAAELDHADPDYQMVISVIARKK